MQYRILGRTGLRVSEVGFGTWGMGGTMWLGAEDQESLRALHRAADQGMNFLDTALVYGEGHSEQLLGKFLRERSDPMIVATKIPPKNFQWPARTGTPLGKAFPYSHIIESTERSLRNLGVETIDLQQLHVWLDDWTAVSEWYEAMSTLKAEGKIRYCGISINDHQPSNALKAVRSGKIDTVQVIHNIFDQNPEDDLFPACQTNNVGVIVRCPFDEGALTGNIRPETTFPAGDWRNRYFKGDRKQQVFDRTEKLRTTLGKEAASLPELALRFCLQHPAVATVIPGMRSARNVDANCAVSDGRQLSSHLMEELRHHAWDKNFYSDPD